GDGPDGAFLFESRRDVLGHAGAGPAAGRVAEGFERERAEIGGEQGDFVPVVAPIVIHGVKKRHGKGGDDGGRVESEGDGLIAFDFTGTGPARDADSVIAALRLELKRTALGGRLDGGL